MGVFPRRPGLSRIEMEVSDGQYHSLEHDVTSEVTREIGVLRHAEASEESA